MDPLRDHDGQGRIVGSPAALFFVALIGALVPITVVSVKKAETTTSFWGSDLFRPDPFR